MKNKKTCMENCTEHERKVIQWAFNLAHSIVAGDYGLPPPMCYAINHLQYVVHELANKQGISIKDGCSNDYLDFHDDYWKGVEDKLKGADCNGKY